MEARLWEEAMAAARERAQQDRRRYRQQQEVLPAGSMGHGCSGHARQRMRRELGALAARGECAWQVVGVTRALLDTGRLEPLWHLAWSHACPAQPEMPGSDSGSCHATKDEMLREAEDMHDCTAKGCQNPRMLQNPRMPCGRRRRC